MAAPINKVQLDDALASISQGRLDEAAAQIKVVLSKQPDSVRAHHLMAQVLVRQGQPTTGLEFLLKAVSLEPNNSALLLDTARVYQMIGKTPEATECYRRCSELLPADGYVRELYTQILMEQWMYSLTGRKIGREASKSFAAKTYSGFFRTYLSGDHVLDIGYRGGFGEAEPIVPQAIGIDLGYPGYDGIRLPFPDNSQDAIYTSHCLEHMDNLREVIREWLRVLKIGGYAVIVVPHQYLYEKKLHLPSKHPDHRHIFTPSKLLAIIEDALPPNHYRVRHLMDNDLFYDYSLPPETHPVGCYEIELVLEKIQAPTWALSN